MAYANKDRLRANRRAWWVKKKRVDPGFWQRKSQEYRRKNPDKIRQWQAGRYGLSKAEWNELCLKQVGLCWLCKRAKKLVIDHDHETGQVRALLCNRCNTGLGFFEHSPFMLERAIRYLQGMYPRNDTPFLTTFDPDKT